jgi:hypothetical protein
VTENLKKSLFLYKITIVKRILTIVFLFGIISAFAQPYGNEWINYNQKYYKFPVAKEGIYRISRNTLVNSGFPIDQISPSFLQLYCRGDEQAIYIKTNTYNLVDYIEFYAKGNDGWLDTSLFIQPNQITNPNFSLINDTIYYFLTWNSSNQNIRYSTEADINFSSYPVSEYCFRTELQNYTSTYYKGNSGSEYSNAEGWFDAMYGLGGSVTKTITAQGAYSTATENSNIEFACITASNAQSSTQYNHHLRVTLPNFSFDTLLSGYKAIKKTYEFETSLLTDNLSITFSSINDQGAITDYQAASYIKLSYPRNYNFLNKSEYLFTIAPFVSSKTVLEITGFDTGSSVLLYDISNLKRVVCTIDEQIVKAILSKGPNPSSCYMTKSENITEITSVKAVSSTGYFTNYIQSETNSEFLIISHPKIWQKAIEYKNYRNQKFKTALVNIEELYGQFAYGINKHPIAIRNFIRKAFNSWTEEPDYLLLLGKSIHINSCRNNASLYESSLVPSFGYPSSDHLLSSGINGFNYTQSLATGRIGAIDNNNAGTYLSKLIDYESNNSDEWMKNCIHFGGGGSVSEQTMFRSYLQNFEAIIEDTLYGGNVVSFFKQSSAPIQITQSDSVKTLINTGISLITFFGHGSATAGFDQNIDNPQTFNNKSKYPFIIANSCYAGDIHQQAATISDNWIFEPNKGAIGFFASVGEAFAQYLYSYTLELYKNIGYKNYGKGVGASIRNTSKNFINSNTSNISAINTSLEFTLHGDPAVLLNAHEKPDLVVDNSSVKWTPYSITSLDDSFDVQIVIKNIGRAFHRDFLIEIKRIFPDQSFEIYNKILPRSLYKDTIYLKLPVDAIKGAGLNTIEIFADVLNEIDENFETNNQVSVSFIILSGDIKPIYPYEFAIVPNSQVTLYASSGNPFQTSMNYVFEIDTTDSFNSSAKLTSTITSGGGIITWTPPLTLSDSTVYYWRVSRIPSPGESFSWNESSFIYINGKTGWSQAHFQQFKNDEFLFIDYQKPEREFSFQASPLHLNCHNIGSPTNYLQYDAIRFTINNSIYDGLGDYTCCGGGPAIMVVVIDSVKLKAWDSNYEDFGHFNYPKCYSRSRYDFYFIFHTDSTSLENMASMIQSVPKGNYVLIYNFRNGNFSNWPENAHLALENIGAVSTRITPNTYPYIYFVKKGYLATRIELVGSSETAEIDLNYMLQQDFNYGQIKSKKIGPSLGWKSFHWDINDADYTTSDSLYLNIIGIDNNGNETIVYKHITKDLKNILSLSDSINYLTHPNVKLEFFTRDDSLKTPVQLSKWQLMFDEAPETAINPIVGYSFYKDTIDEGETISFSISTQNISNYPMDSLLVKYWIQDKNNNLHTITQKRLRKHPAGDIITDSIAFSSIGYAGLNSLWVEFNPVNPATGNFDQIEQYHFNNIAQKFFYVNSDKENPLLDVLFDGIRILNGDIVSAKPQIIIKLKDENRFIELNDTSLFAVYIKPISTGIEKRIYFIDEEQNEVMQWIPAQLPNNSCKIIYETEFDDGQYQLRVQAKDMSGNESGKNDYIINFEVVNKSTITDIFNYPNPFSTSTRFVFTLTGSELPDDIIIQILTVTGKLVRTIDMMELGNVHIGRNISDFAWDGKDMYGDQLANGVYFYRVLTRKAGKALEKRETGAEHFFKKEYGKMYLMR